MKRNFIYLIILFLCFSGCESRSALPLELLEVEKLLYVRPDSALSLIESVKVPDRKDHEVYAAYHLFLCYAQIKNYIVQPNDSLINKALDYYEKYGSKEHRALAFYCAGIVNNDQNNTLKATDYFLCAKELADQTDNYNLRALICIHLGWLYRLMDLFDKSLSLNQEAYEYNLFAKDSLLAIYSLRSIAWCKDELGQLDSALYYHKKALTYTKSLSDIDINLVYSVISGIALVHNLQGNFHESINCLEEIEDLKLDSAHLEGKKFLLGMNYKDLGMYDSAAYYFNQTKDSESIYRVRGSYKFLSDIARSQEDYKKALELNDIYLQARDSIDTFKLSAAIAEIQEKYDYEKLLNVNTQLKLARANSQKLYFFILFVLTCIIFVLYLLYRRKVRLQENQLLQSREMIRKHKTRILENEFIIAQNLEQLNEKELQLVENQQKLQENEKLLQQNKELQREIEKRETAYYQYVENSRNNFLRENEELMMRYERLKKREAQLMEKLIRQNKLLCLVKESGKSHNSLKREELYKVLDSVNDIYDGFANRLEVLYPQLTSEDILICCLLKLKLKSTEIASVTDTMPDAIYKRKQRIKERIGNTSYNSLDEFIYMF